MVLLLQGWVTLLVGNRDPEPKERVRNGEVSWSVGPENVDPGSWDRPDPWEVGSGAFAVDTMNASCGAQELQVELIPLG